MNRMVLLGCSSTMRSLAEVAARYAKTPYPILLLGERGTGKSVLAEQIHTYSGRSGRFVKSSAATIPDNLEVSYLAGHARGAFTGAIYEQVGMLEAAHRGTLFLDEIGLASSRLQQILLQVLDDGTLTRIGEVRARPVDTRIIAGTNEDVDAAVADGRFRADLRDRFGDLVLEVPPLRARRDEVVPLAERFVQSTAAEIRVAAPALSPAAVAALLRHPWPGNVRELESVCRRAVIHAQGLDQIDVGSLPPRFSSLDAVQVETTGRVQTALERSGGNKTEAARLLGISRQHLYRLVRRSGVFPEM